ncbi:hypothetical protein IWW51_005067 [Coemansia sp. RSA 2702]|nr:hypothetical protein IWW51_005067 [Coemansia sp. RSA 2702]
MQIITYLVAAVVAAAAVAASPVMKNNDDDINMPATVTMFVFEAKTVTETVTAYIYGYPSGYSPSSSASLFRFKPTLSATESCPPTATSNNDNNDGDNNGDDNDNGASTTSSSSDTNASSGSGGSASWKTNMLKQVNAIRASVGKPALQLDDRLNKMAEAHSDYQASISHMTHDDTAGSLGQRATQAGVKWSRVAENVAMGYKDVSSAVTGWRNSPGHYNNMIGDYTIIGFGENSNYWTQEFAKSR